MRHTRDRFFVLLAATLVVLAVNVGAPGVARAQRTDEASCPTTLPACTVSRLSCCTRDLIGSATAKAIVIPLDRCHQQIAVSGVDGAPTGGGSAPNWCADAPGSNLNGMFFAYGLVYRLMQSSVPVYWVVNPTKHPTTVSVINATATTKDVDFWVLSPGANPPAPGSALTPLSGIPPIQRLTTDGALNLVVAANYSKNEFPLRGGAFLIAPADRAKFDTFWKFRSGRTNCGSGVDCYDFRDVRLYQVDPSAHFAWQDYKKPLVAGKYVKFDNQLPIAMNIDYAPPKIARFYSGNTLNNWLKASNLDDGATNPSCSTGAAFVPADAVGCDVSEANIQSGALIAANFNWAWVDTGASSTCAATMTKIHQFMTAVDDVYTAGNVLFANSGIALAEQCPGTQVLGKPGTGLALETGAANEGNGKPPFIIRYPTNLFSQYGDLALDFATGAVASWTRWSSAGGNLYSAVYSNPTSQTLRRLVTQESANETAANPYCNGADGAGTRHDVTSVASCDNASLAATADLRDLFAYGRYLNDPENGVVFYSPGANVTQSSQRAQLKMVLSALVAQPAFTVEQVITKVEVSRASPVVAAISNQNAIVK